MSTATASFPGSDTGRTPWPIRGIRNGLVASIAMAMVMMVLGAFDTGFFAAPSSIWAFWAGPAAYEPDAFSLGFILGAMGHMMNSAMLGIVFAFLAARVLKLSGVLTSVMAAVVFALIVMAIMWTVVLPATPNGDIVIGSAATWIWALGHAAFGMVAGWLSAVWR
ncbi:MAG: hypothetical protein ACRDGT_04680 [Candidatus Limnocylindria bacterium]